MNIHHHRLYIEILHGQQRIKIYGENDDSDHVLNDGMFQQRQSGTLFTHITKILTQIVE